MRRSIYMYSMKCALGFINIKRIKIEHFPILSTLKMTSITTDQWLEAAAYRRSVYGLAGTSKVSDERVQEIVSKVLSFAPSSYNTQPVRISLAFGEKHKELWSLILKEAEPILKSINPGLWEKLGPSFHSHKAAYGSVFPQLSSLARRLSNEI